jgi:hypothetical protein
MYGMKKNKRLKAERLPDFKTLYLRAFGMHETKHVLASEFFGVSPDICKSWFDSLPHPTAHRYLCVHCKGYLPYNTHWADCYIDEDGSVVTPWGLCRPSDLAFHHRNKWAAEATRRQLARYREKLAEYQTGTKMKMLLHTADYLNRLVKELTTSE